MQETLDFAKEYKLERSGSSIFGVFDIKGKTYVIELREKDNYSISRLIRHYRVDFPESWEGRSYAFAFGYIPEENVPKILRGLDSDSVATYAIDDATGTGDSFLVFSTVVAFLKDAIKFTDPSVIIFGGVARRKVIYTAMSKRVLKQYPEFDLRQNEELFVIYKKSILSK